MKTSLFTLVLLATSALSAVTDDPAVLAQLTPSTLAVDDPDANALFALLQKKANSMMAQLNVNGTMTADLAELIDEANGSSPKNLADALGNQQAFGEGRFNTLCGPANWNDVISIDYPESIDAAFVWSFNRNFHTPYEPMLFKLNTGKVFMMWYAQQRAYDLEQTEGLQLVVDWPPLKILTCENPYPGDLAPATSVPTSSATIPTSTTTPLSSSVSSTQTVTSTTIVTLASSVLTSKVSTQKSSAIMDTSQTSVETLPNTSLSPYTPPGTSQDSPEPETSQADSPEPTTSQEPVETSESKPTPKPIETSESETTQAQEETSTSNAQPDTATSAPAVTPTPVAPTPVAPVTFSPPSVEELNELDSTVSELKDTLGSILDEIPDSPQLQQLVTDVAASLEDVMSRLADMLSSAPAKRHILRWLMKRDDTSDLTNEVQTLLGNLRDIVGLIEPMENKSDALLAQLDSLKDTISKLEAWLATVTAPERVVEPTSEVSSTPASSSEVSSSEISSMPVSETASKTGPESEPTPSSSDAVSFTAADDISRVDIDHGTATPNVTAPAETSTQSITLTTTQTVTHCEHDACSHLVVVVTTCVPETYTVTECPTVIEDKTVTITVPCEIETEGVSSKNTLSETTTMGADTPKTGSATQNGNASSTPKKTASSETKASSKTPESNENSKTPQSNVPVAETSKTPESNVPVAETSKTPVSNVPVADNSKAPSTPESHAPVAETSKTPQSHAPVADNSEVPKTVDTHPSSAATPQKEDSKGSVHEQGPSPAPVENVETLQTTWTSVSGSQTTTLTGTIVVTRTAGSAGSATPAQAKPTALSPSVAQANSGQKLVVGGIILLPLLMV